MKFFPAPIEVQEAINSLISLMLKSGFWIKKVRYRGTTLHHPTFGATFSLLGYGGGRNTPNKFDLVVRVFNSSELAKTIYEILHHLFAITRYLILKNLAKFIDFAEKGLGAKTVSKMDHGDGTIVHAEFKLCFIFAQKIVINLTKELWNLVTATETLPLKIPRETSGGLLSIKSQLTAKRF